MEKPAPVAHPINELLRRRWSPHQFDARPVEPYLLQRLFEAARWAPSSFNGQPWSYIVGTRENPVEWQKVFDCLVEGNQAWAKTAPVLAISVAELNFAHNGKPNRHAVHDVGAASAMLTIQAMAEGLFVHQMAGILVDKVRETFGVPDTHEPIAALAIGYPGDINLLPDALKQRTVGERKRKPVEEFVFTGKFGAR